MSQPESQVITDLQKATTVKDEKTGRGWMTAYSDSSSMPKTLAILGSSSSASTNSNQHTQALKELLSTVVSRLHRRNHAPNAPIIDRPESYTLTFSPQKALQLVGLGADPNVQTEHYGSLFKILLYTLHRNPGNKEYLLQLVGKNVRDINIKDNQRRTFLGRLLSSQDFCIAEVMHLVRHGADPHTKSSDGLTLIECLLRSKEPYPTPELAIIEVASDYLKEMDSVSYQKLKTGDPVLFAAIKNLPCCKALRKAELAVMIQSACRQYLATQAFFKTQMPVAEELITALSQNKEDSTITI